MNSELFDNLKTVNEAGSTARTARKEIESHIDAAYKVAIKEVERLARSVIKKNHDIHAFVLGMGQLGYFEKGVWGFVDKGMTAIYWAPNKLPPHCEELEDFMDEFGDALHLTRIPMRFTADGEVVTDLRELL